MEMEIKQFIRNRKNRKIGIFVAMRIPETGKVHAGFSLCNKKDLFNKEFGENMALQRAVTSRVYQIPRTVLEHQDYFNNRVKRYFKVSEVNWGASVER